MLAKRYWHKLAVLSLGHGLNDFAAGYMLGNLFYQHGSSMQTAIGFLIYNVLAFGGQYGAAILIKRAGSVKLVINCAMISNIAAILLFSVNPFIAFSIAGCASAFYHVAGGAACTQANKATGIGIFAAPGIIGLIAAGYLAYLRVDVWTILIATAIGFIALLRFIEIKNPADSIMKKEPVKMEIDRHDILMFLLLGMISIRSAAWNIFQVLHEQNYTWLLAIAASAFVGKALGGWLSDKVGWKLYSFVSLVTAMPLVTFFKEEILLFCIGIGLLQSAIPANTALLIQYNGGNKEKAFALSFGVAIIIGLILTAPLKFFTVNGMLYWLLLVLFLLTLFLFKRRPFQLKVLHQP